MKDWVSMGGYAFYIWCSYGALALAIVVEVWSLRRRRAQALEQARLAAEEDLT